MAHHLLLGWPTWVKVGDSMGLCMFDENALVTFALGPLGLKV